MQFTAILLVVFTLASSALAAVAGPCAGSPTGRKPYSVTAFSGFSLSARARPVQGESFTVTDPNTCTTMKCGYTWDAFTPSPHNGFVACSENNPRVKWRRSDGNKLTIRHEYSQKNSQKETVSYTATASGSVPYAKKCEAATGVCDWKMPKGKKAALKVVGLTAVV
ncbi:hypothetical protein EDC01DRAFT_679760 [Geopyxis carbonaria]|nr:hypothetical protein EDC01DRAFT_679760 [Geopyxis carbonaria]